MQTLAEHVGAAWPEIEKPQVAAYFEVLQRAQRTYLDAVAAASAALPAHAEHLREAAALQGRLTRRWFDAQRAILEQRRAVDERIAACIDGTTFLPPSGIDGGRFERQLDALLDEWWRAEQRECGQIVAATFEADALSWAPEELPVDAIPAELVAALDASDPSALARLLDELVADLDAHLAVAAAVAPPAPARPGDLTIIGAPDEHDARFVDFWTAPTEESSLPLGDDDALDPDRSLSTIATRVVLPMVGVTAGLTVLLALIG